MSNRNAVPDLFRDLTPTHWHEAPEQVRGCGGAYVGTMNALIADDLSMVADDGRKIGDGTPDEMRMSNHNAVPDLFPDLHPTHRHEASAQVRGCGGAFVGTMNALIAHDLGVVADDGRKIGDGTADDVRMSNRNAVPDLFRDLHPTHRQEAPAQVRGCGGAYVG